MQFNSVAPYSSLLLDDGKTLTNSHFICSLQSAPERDERPGGAVPGRALLQGER